MPIPSRFAGRIAADPRRSNNYFIVIGDWGKALDAGGSGAERRTRSELSLDWLERLRPGSCQLKVVDLVKSVTLSQNRLLPPVALWKQRLCPSTKTGSAPFWFSKKSSVLQCKAGKTLLFIASAADSVVV